MKILVVNLHSSANAGDHVLTQETVRQLQEAFPGAAITLAMNDPGSYHGPATTVDSFMTWVKRSRHWQWWKVPGLFILTVVAAVGHRVAGPRILYLVPRPYRILLQAYLEATFVVSSAGNFLYSSGRIGLPFLISIYTMAYALLAGKPLYNMPQTVGPMRRSWEKRLVRWVVNRMPLFLVRDVISQDQLEEAGAWHSGCHVVPDLAFAVKPASRSSGEALLRDHSVVPGTSPLLGVTLINWGAQNIIFKGQENYENAVAAAIRSFVDEQGGRCVLFSQVCGPTAAEDDRVPAIRVRDALADLGDAVVIIDQVVEAGTLKSAYGYMDIFMGTRLHSNIFALTEIVPVITIQYQPKTRGVLRMLGLEEWIIVIEEVTSHDLSARLERLWHERYTLRTYIRRQLATVVSEASHIGALLANDYRERQ
jgi:colanic acid/amylovoran biosynthesis protein